MKLSSRLSKTVHILSLLVPAKDAHCHVGMDCWQRRNESGYQKTKVNPFFWNGCNKVGYNTKSEIH